MILLVLIFIIGKFTSAPTEFLLIFEEQNLSLDVVV